MEPEPNTPKRSLAGGAGAGAGAEAAGAGAGAEVDRTKPPKRSLAGGARAEAAGAKPSRWNRSRSHLNEARLCTTKGEGARRLRVV